MKDFSFQQLCIQEFIILGEKMCVFSKYGLHYFDVCQREISQ